MPYSQVSLDILILKIEMAMRNLMKGLNNAGTATKVLLHLVKVLKHRILNAIYLKILQTT